MGIRINRDRWCARFVLAALAVCLAVLGAAPAQASAASLEARLAKAVRESGLSGSTSVVVYDDSAQQIRFQHRQRRAVTPASNEKLYTAAAVLRGLGPEHRFQTTLALEGVQTGERFDGTVYLIGGGDPTLSTREFARRNQNGTGGNLERLTTLLGLRGISSIRGDLVVDESFLDSRRYVPSWPSRFRYDETTALGGLTVNQSYLGRFLGGRAAAQPALHAGSVFVAELAERGTTVSGVVRAGVTPAAAERIGLVESPPLEDIVAFMNRRSDNFTAEILLKDLGRVKRGAGTTRAGGLAARQVLSELGLNLAGVTLADGSGLSSRNRTSARDIADLLNVLDSDATLAPAWMESLAVAGTSGTLKHRMRAFPYRGRVRGKTGTLRQSSALSGYATRTGTGERYGFSVVTYTGGAQVSYFAATRLQDTIASILVR